MTTYFQYFVQPQSISLSLSQKILVKPEHINKILFLNKILLTSTWQCSLRQNPELVGSCQKCFLKLEFPLLQRRQKQKQQKLNRSPKKKRLSIFYVLLLVLQNTSTHDKCSFNIKHSQKVANCFFIRKRLTGM